MEQRVLIVGDQENVVGPLHHLGYETRVAADVRSAAQLIEGGAFAAAVIDAKDCAEFNHLQPSLPVVAVSPQPSFEAAVEALRGGAVDLLCPPISDASVAGAIGRALDHHRAVRVPLAPGAPQPEGLERMEDVERRHILKVLHALGGHRSHAARVLGLDRKTLYRKLEAWGPDATGTSADHSQK